MTGDPRNPKIPEFADLNDAYKMADEFARKVKFESAISAAFQKLRDKYGNAGNKAEVEICQLELEAQEFVFVDGKARPNWIGIDNQGKEIKFPDLSRYNDAELKYFNDRRQQCNDSTIKARYAHLLWESKAKHVDFAKAAIDAYLTSIDDLRRFELEEPKKSRGNRIKSSLESLWSISKSINYRQGDIVALACDIFLNYDYENPSSRMLRLSILNLGLSDWKTLGTALLPQIESVYTLQCKKMDLFNKVEWLLALGRADNKSRLPTIKWREELSQTYEQIGDAFSKQNGAGAASEYFLKAIELEKALKNQPRTSLLEKKFEESRNAIKLTGYGQTIDLTDHAKQADALAKSTIDEHKEGTLAYLHDSIESFLPKVQDIRQESDSMLQQLPLQRNLPQSILDHRGNIVEHFSTQDEISRYWELSTYKLHLECGTTLLLRAIFLVGIDSGAISTAAFEKQLKEKTWLSTKRKVWSASIDTDESFVDLVLPSLTYFINQTRYALKEKGAKPDYVLCTDSLSVKLEGLLRALCEQNDETTFFMRDDKSGRKVVNEQDVNSLLFSKTVKGLFSESELAFLRFILIEKAGFNLRHKVAHALTHVPEYSFEQMVLLATALIIVARKVIPTP